MIVYRAYKGILSLLTKYISHTITRLKFHAYKIRHSSFRTNGIPYVMVSRGGNMSIGENFSMNNGVNGNPIGCYEKCTFFVGCNAVLTIGENVGMSQAALIAIDNITIGNNVKIGGGVCVWTTDFHSLDPLVRNSPLDLKQRRTASVRIHDNAFIGARSIILKGVTIGENSIVAAGAVVTKSIPPNQIWGGNPAKYIRDI